MKTSTRWRTSYSAIRDEDATIRDSLGPMPRALSCKLSVVALLGLPPLSVSLACGEPDAPPVSNEQTPPRAQAKPAKPASIPAAGEWTWSIPKGLTKPPLVPDENPMSAAKVELGHELFMDKRLSVDGSRSCYSCHQNQHGNSDGRTTALGAANKPLPRNTPTIWNVGYQPVLYWDGRAASLEEQAIGALKAGNMGLGNALETKAAEIGALPEYKEAFEKIFGLKAGDTVTSEHVSMALSAYERTLLCGDTAYDRQELGEAQKRGQALFMGPAGCVGCHNGTSFSDGLFHLTGIGIDAKDPNEDLGRGKVTGSSVDNYKFRTPTLRNISKTAPYFHDGSVKTLEEAVRLMASGGQPGVKVDNLLLNRRLADAQIGDLVAFLEALECPGELEVIGDQTAEGIEPPVTSDSQPPADSKAANEPDAEGKAPPEAKAKPSKGGAAAPGTPGAR
jgi:cytochrome c peroxidase